MPNGDGWMLEPGGLPGVLNPAAVTAAVTATEQLTAGWRMPGCLAGRGYAVG